MLVLGRNAWLPYMNVPGGPKDSIEGVNVREPWATGMRIAPSSDPRVLESSGVFCGDACSSPVVLAHCTIVGEQSIDASVASRVSLLKSNLLPGFKVHTGSAARLGLPCDHSVPDILELAKPMDSNLDGASAPVVDAP